MEITIFYITTNNGSSASSLGTLAVDHKLAACANVFPMNSVFPWQGATKHDEEYVLILKTMPAMIDKLTTFIAANHPYDIPCIMHWNAVVNEKYGKWVEDHITS